MEKYGTLFAERLLSIIDGGYGNYTTPLGIGTRTVTKRPTDIRFTRQLPGSQFLLKLLTIGVSNGVGQIANTRFKLLPVLLYDLTSSYVEGEAEKNTRLATAIDPVLPLWPGTDNRRPYYG